MKRTLSGAALLLAASLAAAEERFYPVIAPDGSVQVIRSSGGEPAPVAPASPPATDAVAPGPMAPPAPEQAPPSTGAPAAAEVPYAPYDSEEYVDSESLDAATTSSREGRRFYLINDGMGQLVSEGAAEEAGPAPVEVPVPAPAAGVFAEVRSIRREGGAEALASLSPGLPRCLDDKARAGVPVLDGEAAMGLVVDAADWRFLPPTRVLATYQLAGEGPRILQLRSYARKLRDASFFHPRLALLGVDGCVIRVLHGYFERLYKATDKRHAMLRSDLVVHAEEAYVVVLAPPEVENNDPAAPFRESRLGQLKFTLKK